MASLNAGAVFSVTGPNAEKQTAVPKSKLFSGRLQAANVRHSPVNDFAALNLQAASVPVVQRAPLTAKGHVQSGFVVNDESEPGDPADAIVSSLLSRSPEISDKLMDGRDSAEFPDVSDWQGDSKAPCHGEIDSPSLNLPPKSVKESNGSSTGTEGRKQVSSSASIIAGRSLSVDPALVVQGTGRAGHSVLSNASLQKGESSTVQHSSNTDSAFAQDADRGPTADLVSGTVKHPLQRERSFSSNAISTTAGIEEMRGQGQMGDDVDVGEVSNGTPGKSLSALDVHGDFESISMDIRKSSINPSASPFSVAESPFLSNVLSQMQEDDISAIDMTRTGEGQQFTDVSNDIDPLEMVKRALKEADESDFDLEGLYWQGAAERWWKDAVEQRKESDFRKMLKGDTPSVSHESQESLASLEAYQVAPKRRQVNPSPQTAPVSSVAVFIPSMRPKALNRNDVGPMVPVEELASLAWFAETKDKRWLLDPTVPNLDDSDSLSATSLRRAATTSHHDALMMKNAWKFDPDVHGLAVKVKGLLPTNASQAAGTVQEHGDIEEDAFYFEDDEGVMRLPDYSGFNQHSADHSGMSLQGYGSLHGISEYGAVDAGGIPQIKALMPKARPNFKTPKQATSRSTLTASTGRSGASEDDSRLISRNQASDRRQELLFKMQMERRVALKLAYEDEESKYWLDSSKLGDQSISHQVDTADDLALSGQEMNLWDLSGKMQRKGQQYQSGTRKGYDIDHLQSIGRPGFSPDSSSEEDNLKQDVELSRQSSFSKPLKRDVRASNPVFSTDVEDIEDDDDSVFLNVLNMQLPDIAGSKAMIESGLVFRRPENVIGRSRKLENGPKGTSGMMKLNQGFSWAPAGVKLTMDAVQVENELSSDPVVKAGQLKMPTRLRAFSGEAVWDALPKESSPDVIQAMVNRYKLQRNASLKLAQQRYERRALELKSFMPDGSAVEGGDKAQSQEHSSELGKFDAKAKWAKLKHTFGAVQSFVKSTRVRITPRPSFDKVTVPEPVLQRSNSKKRLQEAANERDNTSTLESRRSIAARPANVDVEGLLGTWDAGIHEDNSVSEVQSTRLAETEGNLLSRKVNVAAPAPPSTTGPASSMIGSPGLKNRALSVRVSAADSTASVSDSLRQNVKSTTNSSTPGTGRSTSYSQNRAAAQAASAKLEKLEIAIQRMVFFLSSGDVFWERGNAKRSLDSFSKCIDSSSRFAVDPAFVPHSVGVDSPGWKLVEDLKATFSSYFGLDIDSLLGDDAFSLLSSKERLAISDSDATGTQARQAFAFKLIHMYKVALSQAFVGRARVCRKFGLLKDAMQDIQASVIIEPTNLDTYLERAQLYIKQGDLQGIKEDFGQMMRLLREASVASKGDDWQTVDTCIAAIKDVMEALSKYDEASSKPMSHEEVAEFCHNADSLLGDEKDQELMEDVEKIIAGDPGCGIAYTMKGRLLARQQKFEEALHFFNLGVMKYPNSPWPFLYRGLFVRQRYPYDAIQDFRFVLGCDPKSIPAYLARADALFVLHEQDSAIQDLETAASILESQWRASLREFNAGFNRRVDALRYFLLLDRQRRATTSGSQMRVQLHVDVFASSQANQDAETTGASSGGSMSGTYTPPVGSALAEKAAAVRARDQASDDAKWSQYARDATGAVLAGQKIERGQDHLAKPQISNALSNGAQMQNTANTLSNGGQIHQTAGVDNVPTNSNGLAKYNQQQSSDLDANSVNDVSEQSVIEQEMQEKVQIATEDSMSLYPDEQTATADEIPDVLKEAQVWTMQASSEAEKNARIISDDDIAPANIIRSPSRAHAILSTGGRASSSLSRHGQTHQQTLIWNDVERGLCQFSLDNESGFQDEDLQPFESDEVCFASRDLNCLSAFRAWMSTAWICVQRRQLSRSLVCCSRAYNLDPTNPSCLLLRAAVVMAMALRHGTSFRLAEVGRHKDSKSKSSKKDGKVQQQNKSSISLWSINKALPTDSSKYEEHQVCIAVKDINRAIHMHPWKSGILGIRARYSVCHGNIDPAVKDCVALIESGASDRGQQIRVIQMLMKMKQYPIALRLATKFNDSKENKHASDILRLIGDIHLVSGDKLSALQQFDKACIINPKDIKAWVSRGLILNDGTQDKQFQSVLLKFIRGNSSSSLTPENQSNSTTGLQIVNSKADTSLSVEEMAMSSFRQAKQVAEANPAILSSDPSIGPIIVACNIYMAEILWRSSKMKASAECLDSALKLNPKHPKALRLRAVVNAALGSVKDSIKDVSLLINHLLVEEEQFGLQAAAPEAAHVVNQKSNPAAMLQRSSTSLRLKGVDGKAKKTMIVIDHFSSQLCPLLFMRALLLLRQYGRKPHSSVSKSIPGGQLSSAWEDFEEITERQPNCAPEVWYWFAVTSQALGKLDEADVLYTRAITGGLPSHMTKHVLLQRFLLRSFLKRHLAAMADAIRLLQDHSLRHERTAQEAHAARIRAEHAMILQNRHSLPILLLHHPHWQIMPHDRKCAIRSAMNKFSSIHICGEMMQSLAAASALLSYDCEGLVKQLSVYPSAVEDVLHMAKQDDIEQSNLLSSAEETLMFWKVGEHLSNSSNIKSMLISRMLDWRIVHEFQNAFKPSEPKSGNRRQEELPSQLIEALIYSSNKVSHPSPSVFSMLSGILAARPHMFFILHARARLCLRLSSAALEACKQISLLLSSTGQSLFSRAQSRKGRSPIESSIDSFCVSSTQIFRQGTRTPQGSSPSSSAVSHVSPKGAGILNLNSAIKADSLVVRVHFGLSCISQAEKDSCRSLHMCPWGRTPKALIAVSRSVRQHLLEHIPPAWVSSSDVAEIDFAGKLRHPKELQLADDVRKVLEIGGTKPKQRKLLRFIDEMWSNRHADVGYSQVHPVQTEQDEINCLKWAVCGAAYAYTLEDGISFADTIGGNSGHSAKQNLFFNKNLDSQAIAAKNEDTNIDIQVLSQITASRFVVNSAAGLARINVLERKVNEYIGEHSDHSDEDGQQEDVKQTGNKLETLETLNYVLSVAKLSLVSIRNQFLRHHAMHPVRESPIVPVPVSVQSSRNTTNLSPKRAAQKLVKPNGKQPSVDGQPKKASIKVAQPPRPGTSSPSSVKSPGQSRPSTHAQQRDSRGNILLPTIQTVADRSLQFLAMDQARADHAQTSVHVESSVVGAILFIVSGRLSDAELELKRLEAKGIATAEILGLQSVVYWMQSKNLGHDKAAAALADLSKESAKKAAKLDPHMSLANITGALASLPNTSQKSTVMERKDAYGSVDWNSIMELLTRSLQVSEASGWVDPSCTINRAMAAGAVSNHHIAISDMSVLVKQMPGDHNLWNNNAILLQQSGRLDDALQAIDKAIDICPLDDGLWATRAQIQKDKGDVIGCQNSEFTVRFLRESKQSGWNMPNWATPDGRIRKSIKAKQESAEEVQSVSPSNKASMKNAKKPLQSKREFNGDAAGTATIVQSIDNGPGSLFSKAVETGSQTRHSTTKPKTKQKEYHHGWTEQEVDTLINKFTAPTGKDAMVEASVSDNMRRARQAGSSAAATKAVNEQLNLENKRSGQRKYRNLAVIEGVEEDDLEELVGSMFDDVEE